MHEGTKMYKVFYLAQVSESGMLYLKMQYQHCEQVLCDSECSEGLCGW